MVVGVLLALHKCQLIHSKSAAENLAAKYAPSSPLTPGKKVIAGEAKLELLGVSVNWSGGGRTGWLLAEVNHVKIANSFQEDEAQKDDIWPSAPYEVHWLTSTWWEHFKLDLSDTNLDAKMKKCGKGSLRELIGRTMLSR